MTLVVTFQCCTDESYNKNFLKNKAAQVFSLIFVCDYPEKVSLFTCIVISCVIVKNHNFSRTECHLSAMQQCNSTTITKSFQKTKEKIEKHSRTQYTAVKLTHTLVGGRETLLHCLSRKERTESCYECEY